MSTAGDLYFIKRPYEPPHATVGNLLSDTLLFPFRLLRAVFHYLNFFSMMYSKKPLTSAGGPRINADAKTLILRGKRIETEKALKKLQPIQGAPSLVPASWQLIRCKPDGEKTVVATHVASYCINGDDHVIYSNGCGVFYLDDRCASVKLAQENLIEEVYC